MYCEHLCSALVALYNCIDFFVYTTYTHLPLYSTFLPFLSLLPLLSVHTYRGMWRLLYFSVIAASVIAMINVLVHSFKLLFVSLTFQSTVASNGQPCLSTVKTQSIEIIQLQKSHPTRSMYTWNQMHAVYTSTNSIRVIPVRLWSKAPLTS